MEKKKTEQKSDQQTDQKVSGVLKIGNGTVQVEGSFDDYVPLNSDERRIVTLAGNTLKINKNIPEYRRQALMQLLNGGYRSDYLIDKIFRAASLANID